MVLALRYGWRKERHVWSLARSQDVFHLVIEALLVRLRYPHLALFRRWSDSMHCGYIKCDMIMTHDSRLLSLMKRILLVANWPNIMGARVSYYLLECDSLQPFAPGSDLPPS